MIKKILYDFANVIYPKNIYCISCGIPIEHNEKYSLCSPCRKQLLEKEAERCVRCGRFFSGKGKDILCLDCSAKERQFTRGITCTVYDDQAKKIIFNMKYSGKTYLRDPIAEIMWDQIDKKLDFDLIIPVPMHLKKRRKRGFNQAELIASEIAALSDKNFSKECLIRTKNTTPMSGLKIEERKKNIKNVFSVEKPEDIKNKAILLIDDIFTTGSTASECSRILFASGASVVYVLTFAATNGENITTS